MKDYPSNLTDIQWQICKRYLGKARKRKYFLRDILNAIFYVVKTGCQWRMLPGDFPPHEVVFYYFNTWKKKGIINKMHDKLVKEVRKKEGKKPQPTAAVIDSQSTKNTLVACESQGYDGGKNVKGVKKIIVTDTAGLMLAVIIHPANIHDSVGATFIMEKLNYKWKKVTKLFADQGYRGELVDWTKKEFGIAVEIVKRARKKFEVLPKRWVVERTFSWLDTNRRNSKFYERLDETGVAILEISSIRFMLNRLIN